jgi:hypothetical protein
MQQAIARITQRVLEERQLAMGRHSSGSEDEPPAADNDDGDDNEAEDNDNEGDEDGEGAEEEGGGGTAAGSNAKEEEVGDGAGIIKRNAYDVTDDFIDDSEVRAMSNEAYCNEAGEVVQLQLTANSALTSDAASHLCMRSHSVHIHLSPHV